jgi:hypothetical protein
MNGSFCLIVFPISYKNLYTNLGMSETAIRIPKIAIAYGNTSPVTSDTADTSALSVPGAEPEPVPTAGPRTVPKNSVI